MQLVFVERRSFLVTLGATAASLIISPLAAQAQGRGPARAAAFARALRAALGFTASSSLLSGAPKDWTPEKAVRLLTEGLSPTQVSSLVEDPRALAQAITARIREDEVAGAVVIARGWVVTEAEAAALTLLAATGATSA